MLTKFFLALLLSGSPFSSTTPHGIEIVNVAQRDIAPVAVDKSFDEGTPGLASYLLFKGLIDPSFGGFVDAAYRTRVVMIPPPECPGSFQWAVFKDHSGAVPDVGYTVVINSALSDDLVSFYPALTQAFAREKDLIEGTALPMTVNLCDSTVTQ